MKKILFQEFITRVKKIHNKYSYEKSIYVGLSLPIIIICPIHGEFLQKPREHLAGCGCTKCGRSKDRYKENYKKIFIDKSNLKHNYYYDYNSINYVNNSTKIQIICPIHGIFLQTPNDHIDGHGCKKCGIKQTRARSLKPVEKLIEEFNKAHGFKYIYDKVKYINAHTPVTIICPSHGEFNQSPHHHRRGIKCPRCNTKSKGESIIRDYLIRNKIDFEEQKKFQSCKNKGYLPFDFYIVKINKLIEFQGRQHFEPIRRRSSWDSDRIIQEFDIIKNHDQIKKSWCNLKENPNLLEIPYWEISNIDEILKREFSIIST